MKLLTAAAMAALLLAGQARAADPAAEARKDSKCLLAMGWLSQVKPEMREGALVAQFYFLGRLQGRDPDLDLGQRLRRDADDLSQSELIELAKSCGETARDQGAAYRKAAESLRGVRGVGR